MISVHLFGLENRMGSVSPASEFEARVRQAVRWTLATESVERADITVALLLDDEIRTLNRQFLGHDRVTDVLSFALNDEAFNVSEEFDLSGEIDIGVGPASAQADEFGCSVDEEILRLVVHGTLHLLGHDHPEGRDRVESPFWTVQENLVRRLMSDPPRSAR